MAHLLSLPNELILSIFLNLADVQCAANLSQTSKRLNEIWDQSCNQILSAIFSRSIPAYDEALALVKAEHKLSSENIEDVKIDIRALARTLLERQQMCARVLSLYEQDFKDTLEYGYKYDTEMTARAYFRSLLVLTAYDNAHMRRGVRRRLKKLSEDELRYQAMFLTWFIDEMRYQDIRNFHDLGTADADNPDHHDPYGFLIPMKWHFTVDTVNLQLARLMNPGEPIGEHGLWSNASAQGFQESWW